MSKTTRVAVLLLLLIYLNLQYPTAYIEGVFTDSQGQETSFTKYEGKPLIIEAFSTKCGHCQAEHAELIKLWDVQQNTFNMLSLSIYEKDTPATLNAYNTDYPTTWDLGLDTNKQIETLYKITAVPTIVLIDATGTFASCHVGEIPANDLISQTNSFIADSAAYIESHKGSGVCEEVASPFESPIMIVGVVTSIFIAIYYIIKARNAKQS